MRFGGMVGYVVSALIIVAVGVAIWSRTPLWPLIRKS